jgi:cell wall-associated NlpC family hydrolase
MLHADRGPRNRLVRTTVIVSVVAALQLGSVAAFATTAPMAQLSGDAHAGAIRYELDEMRLNQAWARDLRAEVQARRVRIVIAAAKSQIGVPYVYASARPGHGFDCSGLVMWAWSRAGVKLPHNSTDQYLALPHVSRADLRPGDVLYFLEPEDHVAIYLGGDLMIHAPGWGNHVRIERIYWRYFAGGARPGA